MRGRRHANAHWFVLFETRKRFNEAIDVADVNNETVFAVANQFPDSAPDAGHYWDTSNGHRFENAHRQAFES